MLELGAVGEGWHRRGAPGVEGFQGAAGGGAVGW
jgi:hypothetical protein